MVQYTFWFSAKTVSFIVLNYILQCYVVGSNNAPTDSEIQQQQVFKAFEIFQKQQMFYTKGTHGAIAAMHFGVNNTFFPQKTNTYGPTKTIYLFCVLLPPK